MKTINMAEAEKDKICLYCGGNLVIITDAEHLDWYYCRDCGAKLPKPFILKTKNK